MLPPPSAPPAPAAARSPAQPQPLSSPRPLPAHAHLRLQAAPLHEARALGAHHLHLSATAAAEDDGGRRVRKHWQQCFAHPVAQPPQLWTHSRPASRRRLPAPPICRGAKPMCTLLLSVQHGQNMCSLRNTQYTYSLWNTHIPRTDCVPY
eukprot:1159255-Pelagomonas_calceolata.AAC.4